ncbi:MAG TPA: YciI family protein [Cyclobacteriaceae bacterium]|nr:YciI family protein [Cyclobacteriaceae bacterium]HMV07732.1 YciI family protein [Cyclobacteriaceae bacterium]HMV88000.1 YciI family protein [Cyclobacteriaceae bacterium]HMW98867.1 YciI family protein [Cyclobacteriaceae bacterium]HMX48500.1 YciI family protein [Cyclobacteriaceae bacterium]
MKKFFVLFLFVTLDVAAFAQAKSYTFVFLNNKPDKEVLSKEKSDSIMQGHMNNIGRLAKEGKLLAAGPFEGGGGLFVLNTISVDEAKQWLETDPGVKAKRWNIEMFPFTPTVNSICPVGEKYEMVFYQFVRFTAAASSESINKHAEFIQQLSKEGLVIGAGDFDTRGNGILILKADVTKERVDTDPLVVSGALKAEMKKLYIAKGSFCEK